VNSARSDPLALPAAVPPPPGVPWAMWLIGAAAMASLAWVCVHLMQSTALTDDRSLRALLGGAMAAAATALGTVPALLTNRFSKRVHGALLGFGAGVMLAASAFSLVIPGLAAAQSLGAGRWEAGATVGLGMLLGAALVLSLERIVPQVALGSGPSEAQALALKRTWLFTLAIVLHNLPEGLAIGVGYAGNDLVRANALATGIALQDLPEGLVVALALRAVGYGRVWSVGVGAVSGLIEPVGAVLGATLIGVSAVLLPWGLAGAAGAMLFVICHDIIPESHLQGHARVASGSLIAGFVLMMLLDTALG
jgi:ZIP family zinc transporter